MTNQFDEDMDLDQEEDKEKLEIAKRAKDTERAIFTRLQTILRKNSSQLLLDDKQFLKARASYLSKAQREEYADVISADYSDHKIVDESVAEAEPKLEELSRTALDIKAKALGIGNPEELPNKKAVIEAIQHYQ